MDLGRLRRDAHLLGAPPGDRSDVAVEDVVCRNQLFGCLGQIIHAGRHLEAEDSRRIAKPLIVVLQVEDLAVIDPLAFEDAARIMQPMAEHMQLGFAPGDEAAVIPDKAVTVVEGDHGHGVFLTATYCNILGLGLPHQAAARYTAENTFSISEVASYVNMTDIKSVALPFFPVEDEVRQGIELLFFAYRDFTAEPDAILAQYGFGRAHHRVIHFVGRHPQMTVSELLGILRITKQSLSRVLGHLVHQEFVLQRPGSHDRRQRLLELTPKGQELEQRLSEPQRARIANAYRQAGAAAVEAFRTVLLGIIAAEENRRRFESPSAMR